MRDRSLARHGVRAAAFAMLFTAAFGAQAENALDRLKSKLDAMKKPAPANAAARSDANAGAATADAAAADNGGPIAFGDVDVVGIRIGMPVADALAKLKAYQPALEIKQHPWVVPGTSQQYVQVAVGEARSRSGSVLEQVYVGFTLPPNPQVVYSVRRSITFAEGKEPEKENTLGALREKYGSDGLLQVEPQSTLLTWARTAQGQPLPLPITKQCGGWFSSDRLFDSDSFYRPPGGGAQSKLLIPCYSASYVRAYLRPTPRNPAIVAQLQVTMENEALHNATMAKTRAMMADIQNQGASRDVERAKGENKPKL